MRTILIIEDDSAIRNMIRNFLELENYIVVCAENGNVGIELAQKFLPDLIISDVLMPVCNGYEVKRELSKTPLTDIIPFIYLTSQSERNDIRTGMELGADDYLFKPFDLKELSNSIITQLKKREKLVKEFDKNVQPEKYEYNDHILVKIRGNLKFIKVDSIVYVEADQKYTTLHLDSKEKHIISKSLKEWEEKLPSNKFVRIHRSTIVNIEFIEKTEKWFNRSYKVELNGVKEPLYISRRYYSKLKDLF